MKLTRDALAGLEAALRRGIGSEPTEDEAQLAHALVQRAVANDPAAGLAVVLALHGAALRFEPGGEPVVEAPLGLLSELVGALVTFMERQTWN